MKRAGVFGTALPLLCLLVGCNTLGRQPQLMEAQITPSTLRPGDSALITVKVKDKYDIVRDVVGVIREDQRQKFRLRDDGQPPHDTTAGDGIWSFMVDVPFLAPPGQFTLEFTALDSRGNPVIVKTQDGAVPLKQTCIFAIHFPPENAGLGGAPPGPSAPLRGPAPDVSEPAR